jgi:hypothetical protein
MEWHFNFSPYAYCYDNPVGYIDPDGMDASPGFQDDWNGDIARRDPKPPKPIKIDPVYVIGYTKVPWYTRVWNRFLNWLNTPDTQNNGCTWTTETGGPCSTNTQSTHWEGEYPLDDMLLWFMIPKELPLEFTGRNFPEALKYSVEGYKEVKEGTSDKKIVEEHTGTAQKTNANGQPIDDKGNVTSNPKTATNLPTEPDIPASDIDHLPDSMKLNLKYTNVVTYFWKDSVRNYQRPNNK